LRVVAIIQARLGSTRLPGKVLIDLDGTAVLGHVISRTQRIVDVDEVAVATTSASKDDGVAEYAADHGVTVFRGDELDVLNRYRDCAREMQADVVVRITADCPLIDPELSSRVVGRYLEGDLDYVSNYKPPTFPDGLDTEVFSFAAIDEAQKNAERASEREHVTPYIWQHPENFRLANITQKVDHSGLCWTLDSPQDLEMMQALAAHLEMRLVDARYRDLMKVIRDHPEVAAINGEWVRNDKMESMFWDEGFYKPRE
jgi:spore coat polysaccharide biosynthesis protein SpsF (cytidylyltransferase family)